MKRNKCKNYDRCQGWQMYPSLELCKNCYAKLRGFNTGAYRVARKINKRRKIKK
jgi:hypothetical protein